MRMDLGIVSWNTRDELRRALASIRRHGEGRRVVVVDHASTDGSPEMVAEEFPEADLIRAENRGFAAGANRLLSATAPADLLLLNADVELTPGAADRLERALAEDPRAAAAGPRLVHEGGPPQHSAYRFPSLGLAAWLNSGLWRLRAPAWQAEQLLETSPQPSRSAVVDWVIGAAMALRRTAVEAVGGFDERFFMYAEDLEWCHRASRAGWHVRYEPTATVVHLGNRAGAQAFGGARTAAWLESTYAFARSVHGPAWARAYFALNAAGTGGRYAAARLRHAVSPSEGTRRALAMWGPHVAYHLRGRRPLRERASR
jgi:N-acetylglucosaminyl-diphospho-decaprenol L-rhamnosyltransferase